MTIQLLNREHMPLISYPKKTAKVPIKVEISSEIEQQINAYCKWSGIIDLGYFFEEASKFIMEKDGLWLNFLGESIESE